jgi:hypothetical protein
MRRPTSPYLPPVPWGPPSGARLRVRGIESWAHRPPRRATLVCQPLWRLRPSDATWKQRLGLITLFSSPAGSRIGVPISARCTPLRSGHPAERPQTFEFSSNDLVVFRLFFSPSPHIPGKVPVGPYLPANVGAPSRFSPGRSLQPDFTNRRVPIHRCPGIVYGAWT